MKDCCHYPKSSAHPSSSIGEGNLKQSWPEHTTTEYPGVGVAGTRYDGDRVKTITLGGGEKSGDGGSDYPKKSRRFGTERS
jgi:hypothetical protein